MPEVTWSVRDEGTAAVIQQFQELTKAEQKAAIAAAGLSDQLGAAGRKDKELKRLTSGAFELAGAFGLVTSVTGAITASMEILHRRFEQTIQLAKDAQEASDKLTGGKGNLIGNDPNLTPEDRQAFDAVIRRVGPRLGKRALEAPEALARGRDRTGNATPAQQIEAFDIATRDIELFGESAIEQIPNKMTAIIKIQEALAKSGKASTAEDANNVLISAGSKAGVDSSVLAEAIIPLINNPNATVAQSSSLFGFATSEGLDAKPAETAVKGLLQNLTKPQFNDTSTGTAFSLNGETSFDKLRDFLDRVKSGNIDPNAGIRALVGEDVGKTTLLQGLIGKRDSFAQTLAANEKPVAGSLFKKLLATQNEANPQNVSTNELREVKGEAEFRVAGDLQGKAATDAAEAIVARRRGLGLLSGPADESMLSGIKKRAIDASKKSGGLKEFADDAARQDLFKAFNIGTGSGEDYDIEETQREEAIRKAFAQGGEKGALKEIVAQGRVTPSDGISGAERAALSASGISDEQLNKLQQAFIEGNKASYQALFAALEKTLTNVVREAKTGHKASDLEN